MKRKIYQTAVLFCMATLLFYMAKGNAIEDNSREMTLVGDTSYSVETMETEWIEEGTEEATEIEAVTEAAYPEMSEAEEAELGCHYGVYRITEYGTDIYSATSDLPEQEADMLIGQMIVIQPEILSVYDTKRWPHSENNDYYFYSNYMIERYVEENPGYRWIGIYDLDGEMEWLKPDKLTDGIAQNVIWDYFNAGRLEGVISARASSSFDGRKPHMANYYFYTLNEDTDRLIMYSERTTEYFLLERSREETVSEEPQPELSDGEILELMQGIYGKYQVSEFLPTKFFTVWDGDLYTEKCDVLPEEEACLMIGKEIMISEGLFTTYDNYRRPTSAAARRLADDFWIKKKEIEQPDYRVRTVPRNEIYGLRDDGMLPDSLTQQEYVEISVYPGYEVNDGWEYLPQMFLAGEGKILFLAMGEYFLLERMDSLEENNREASENMPDLSSWIGTYVFSEESGNVKTKKWIKNEDNDSYNAVEVSRSYRIEVMENDKEECYAFITIQEEGNGPEVKILADVCGSRETVSFVLKEYISGELSWFERHSDVLLSIRKDTETGELTTHWGGLNHGREPGNHFIKE